MANQRRRVEIEAWDQVNGTSYEIEHEGVRVRVQFQRKPEGGVVLSPQNGPYHVVSAYFQGMGDSAGYPIYLVPAPKQA